MNNVIEKIKQALRHNQFLAIAVVLVLCLGVWLIGCESTTISPISGKRVTRAQLVIENDTYIKNLGLAKEDLDKQDLFKQKIFEIGVAMAEGGTVNPVGAGVTMLSILGFGAVADNRKKDAIIKTLKNNKETV